MGVFWIALSLKTHLVFSLSREFLKMSSVINNMILLLTYVLLLQITIILSIDYCFYLFLSYNHTIDILNYYYPHLIIFGHFSVCDILFHISDFV